MTDMNKNSIISKSITDDLFKGVEPGKITDIDFSQGSPVNTTSSSSSSSGSSMSSFNWFVLILVVIFFLAFIGFNIFTFLSKGTDEVTQVFKPVFDLFANTFGGTVKDVASTSTTGVETSANISAGVVKGAAIGGMKGFQLSQDELDSSSSSTSHEMDDNQLNTSLQSGNNGGSGGAGGGGSSSGGGGSNSKYTPDDSFSSIQTTGKSGFCYYGSDNGTRYCTEVGANEKCVSEQIFPTREICINPNLRE